MIAIRVGHAPDELRRLGDASVHLTVSSPPYYGLRDYGLPPTTWGGADDCPHEWQVERVEGEMRRGLGMAKLSEAFRGGGIKAGRVENISAERAWCCRCGAWRGALGLEPTWQMYVAHLVEIFEEVRRVTRDDGLLFLNLGDSYYSNRNPGGVGANSTINGQDTQEQLRLAKIAHRKSRGHAPHGVNERDGHEGKHGYRVGSNRAQRGDGNDGAPFGPVHQPNRMPQTGFKPKDLMGIPWRVAFALQDAGWYLRQDNIWHKPNPMPESVTDRCTKAHEYVFMFSKSEHYFYDAEATKEESVYQPGGYWEEEEKGTRGGKRGKIQERPIDPEQSFRAIRTKRNRRSVWTIATRPFDGEFCRACQTYFEGDRLRALRVEEIKRDDGSTEHRRHCSCGAWDRWLSHFATFPPELVEPLVKAGTSEKGCCAACGSPYEREVSKELLETTRAPRSINVSPRVADADSKDQGSNRARDGHKRGYVNASETVGWRKTCACASYEVVPATVLDPFGGAGTTALVADRCARDSIIIEQNPEYAEMARQRLHLDGQMFSRVEMTTRAEAAE